MKNEDDFDAPWLPEALVPLTERLHLPPYEEARKQAIEAGKRYRGESEQIALRMPVLDLERARQIAQRKGMPYQTLLKSLIHEGLDRLAAE